MDLNKKTDIELIKIIKESGSSEAFLILKERNEKSYYRVCETYVKKVPLLKYEDLIEDCDYVLNKSIQSFNPDKETKFSSWHTNHSRYHVLNTIKYLNEVGYFIPVENSQLDFLNNSFNKFHFDNREDLKEYVFSVLNNLNDDRIKKIFELRYYSDKQSQKWRNIGKAMNLSTQQCVNLYEKGKKIIYKKIIKENNKE